MAGVAHVWPEAAAGTPTQRHDGEHRLLDAHRGGQAIQSRGGTVAGQLEPNLVRHPRRAGGGRLRPGDGAGFRKLG